MGATMTEEQIDNLIDSINTVENERLTALFNADELEESITNID